MTKYKYYIFKEANNALVRFRDGKPYDAEILLDGHWEERNFLRQWNDVGYWFDEITEEESKELIAKA